MIYHLPFRQVVGLILSPRFQLKSGKNIVDLSKNILSVSDHKDYYAGGFKVFTEDNSISLDSTPYTSCRANVGNFIRDSFICLKEELNKKNIKKVRIYYDKYPGKIGIKLRESYVINDLYYLVNDVFNNPNKTNLFILLMDAVLSNTCVLLDDVKDIKLKAYDYCVVENNYINYSSISSFWLKSYQLMSLVTGLARFCVLAVAQSTDSNNYAKVLLDSVSRKNIIKAIETKDFDLASFNFKKLEKPLLKMMGGNTNNISSFNRYPFHPLYKDAFHFFINKGINHWFKGNIMNRWCGNWEGHGKGWETFLINVDIKMKKAKKEENNNEIVKI